LTVFFMILGSACVKAFCKMLVKSTPVINATNILKVAFDLADPESAKRQSSCLTFLHFWDLLLQNLLVL